MWLAGVEVSGTDGRTLVDLLLRIGRDADLALAHRIDRGYSRQVPLLALSYKEPTFCSASSTTHPKGSPNSAEPSLATSETGRSRRWLNAFDIGS